MIVHVPSPATDPVHRIFPDPSVIVIVVPISHVPVTIGVVSLVIYPGIVSHPALVITGRGGTTVSTVNVVTIDKLVFRA